MASTRKSLPKSTKNIILRSLSFARDPIKSITDQTSNLGHFYRDHLGYRQLNVCAEPEGVKHILQTNNRNYIKDIAYQQLKLVLGNGLLTNEGESWRKHRRMAQPAFYKSRMEELFDIMLEAIEPFIQNVKELKRSGKEFDLSRLMMEVTLEVVSKAMFSSHSVGNTNLVYDSVTNLQQYIINRIRKPFYIPFSYLNGDHRKFRYYKKAMDELVLEVIEEHRTTPPKRQDLLTMLIDAKDADTGEGMSNQQLIDESLTILAAGHETSANALTWAWYLLSQHPDVLERLKDEADTVFANGAPVFEQVRSLRYAKQVMEEAMRLYPPAWAIGRQSLADDEVCGYHIPKSSIVIVPIFILHKRQDFWEDPELFNPDRFDEEASQKRPKFVHMPFGGGPRICIGNHFAMMEMQLILAMMARETSFVLNKSHPIKLDPLITLRPRFGMHGKFV